MEHRVQIPNNRVSFERGQRLACLAVIAVGMAAGQASASVERLPQEIRTNADLSSDQRQQVQKFVAEQIGRMRTGDPVAIEEGRRSLMSAFEGAEPTIGFRLEFGRAAAPDLKRLVTDKDMQRAINAVLVAGACGTSETIDVIAVALGDQRPAIRVASATALREVISTSSGSQVRRGQGSEAVRRCGAALAKETDPVVALALVAALEPARGTQFHGEAADVVGVALGPVAAAMPAPAHDAGVRGAEAIQRGVSIMFTRLIDPAQASQLDKKYYQAVVSAGAHALGYASRNADVVVDPENADGAAAVGLVVAAAEQSVQFGLARLNNTTPESSALKGAFDAAVASGDAEAFQAAANAMIARVAKDLGVKASDFGG